MEEKHTGTDLTAFLPPEASYFRSVVPQLDPPAYERPPAMIRLAIPIPPKPVPPPKPIDNRPTDAIGRHHDEKQGIKLTEEEENRVWEVLARNKLDTRKTVEDLKAAGIEVSMRTLQRRLKPIMMRAFKENTFPKALLALDRMVDISDENDSKDEISWEVRQRAVKDTLDRALGKPKQSIKHTLDSDKDLSDLMDDSKDESPEDSGDPPPVDGQWYKD